MFTLTLVRFPPTKTKENHYLNAKGNLTYTDIACFFFSSRRRHTRFKCDWSSDVCSSDLARTSPTSSRGSSSRMPELWIAGAIIVLALRSEERRVGKECRSRWSPYH